MVWFQCDDCGENLKKPKLVNHFNRCSARKLSCIDCGVVFDRHSVQAHTTCVSEVEKYGPKGVSKPANPSASKTKNGKVQSGPEVDVSRGLTQRPPWSCSLCNVKATSREALELHAQGKKHRGKAKAAALKEAPPKDAVENAANDPPAEKIGSVEMKSASSEPLEKKRKNDQVDGGEAEEELKPAKKDKKAKEEPLDPDLEVSGHNVAGDSPSKKRKHVEAEPEKVTVLESKGSGKKSKKRVNLASPEENGHTSEKVADVAEARDQDERKKDKKSKKGKKAKEEALTTNGKSGSPVNGPSSAHLADTNGESDTPLMNGKKAKKGKAVSVVEEPVLPDHVEIAKEEKSRSEKKKHKKSVSKCVPNDDTPRKEKERETIVHEVSFREWLEDDEVGGNGGTPTHPSTVEKSGDDASTEPTDVDNEQTKAASKVLKWKKIISESLGKTPEGRMKKKDLSKAVLSVALKAAEASHIPLDKLVLKEEFMRQVKSSPKFVVDGKHVMLA